jgi:hypothetical protein
MKTKLNGKKGAQQHQKMDRNEGYKLINHLPLYSMKNNDCFVAVKVIASPLFLLTINDYIVVFI